MEIDPPKQAQLQIKDEDLFKAAEAGDFSIFKALSSEHLSKALSLQNDDGRSLLHVAVSSGHLEVSSTSYTLFEQIFCHYLRNVCVRDLSSYVFVLMELGGANTSQCG